MDGDGQFPAGGGEFVGEFGEGPAVYGGAGDEHQVESGGDQGLMLTEHLAEPALGAGAGDGRAHLRGGGNKPHTGRSGLAAGAPPQGEGAAVQTLSLFPDRAKIARPAQMLLRSESHGTAGGQGGRSDDGQAFATLAATGRKDLAATNGGLAGAKTNLAGAL